MVNPQTSTELRTENPEPEAAATSMHRGSVADVFMAFLRLGLTPFGGPVAHLGYFRSEFVERRQWMDDRSYADLVALCQFLPGPASSQVGMALGLSRAGWLGALAAWAGFTLPSAIVLILFAYGLHLRPGLGEADTQKAKNQSLPSPAHRRGMHARRRSRPSKTSFQAAAWRPAVFVTTPSMSKIATVNPQAGGTALLTR